MAKLQECKCEGYTYYTYEEYCICVDEIIAEKKNLSQSDKNKYKQLIEFLKIFKQKLALQLRLMGVGIRDLIQALMDRNFYAILNILKFDLTLILKAMGAAQRLVAQGVLKILRVVATREGIMLFRAKVVKIDEFIKKYPILKYVTGLGLCGLLIYMWSNMTFIGDFDFDFDLQNAFLAIIGAFTIYHLFGTDEGLLFIMLFFTGVFNIINFNWILSTPVLMIIMVIYSVNKNPQWRTKIKSWIKNHSQKVNTTVYKYSSVKKYDLRETIM